VYIGHGRLSVCLSVPRRTPTLLHGPGCNLGDCRKSPLVVHYRADLQSMHGFRSYDDIAPNAKCQRVLVLGHMPGFVYFPILDLRLQGIALTRSASILPRRVFGLETRTVDGRSLTGHVMLRPLPSARIWPTPPLLLHAYRPLQQMM